jgi:hypothetical protein
MARGAAEDIYRRDHVLAQAQAQLGDNSSSMLGTFSSDTAAAADANQDEMHRLISGFDEYQTASGDRKSVPYAAATNWWTNGRGQTVGTQGQAGPAGFQEMTRVPAGRNYCKPQFALSRPMEREAFRRSHGQDIGADVNRSLDDPRQEPQNLREGAGAVRSKGGTW